MLLSIAIFIIASLVAIFDLFFCFDGKSNIGLGFWCLSRTAIFLFFAYWAVAEVNWMKISFVILSFIYLIVALFSFHEGIYNKDKKNI